MGNVIVVRERKVPPRLRRLAKEAGVEPVALLSAALRDHSTYAEAAEALQVTPKTLLNWRRRMGVEVVG